MKFTFGTSEVVRIGTTCHYQMGMVAVETEVGSRTADEAFTFAKALAIATLPEGVRVVFGFPNPVEG